MPFLTVSYLLLYSISDIMVTEWIKVLHFACILISAQKDYQCHAPKNGQSYDVIIQNGCHYNTMWHLSFTGSWSMYLEVALFLFIQIKPQPAEICVVKLLVHN